MNNNPIREIPPPKKKERKRNEGIDGTKPKKRSVL